MVTSLNSFLSSSVMSISLAIAKKSSSSSELNKGVSASWISFGSCESTCADVEALGPGVNDRDGPDVDREGGCEVVALDVGLDVGLEPVGGGPNPVGLGAALSSSVSVVGFEFCCRDIL